MKKTQLANKRRRTNNEEDFRIYRRQKNFVDRECKRVRRAYLGNLDVKLIQDNKTFWKTMGNEFSDKTKGNHKITLVKGDNIISKDDDVAKEFGDVFSNAVERLDIPQITINHVEGSYDVVDTAVLRYKDHPSILKIN